MPLPTATASSSTIFLFVLILAFFPDIFFGILKLPFKPFFNSTPPVPTLATCACCPPAHCYNNILATANPPTLPTTPPAPQPATMSWFQKSIALPPKSKGAYLVTDHVTNALPELREYKVGLLNLFVQHTSCALSLNENWDEDVRDDMSDALDRIAPEDRKGDLYRHSAEGLDDMPAHIKSALVGASVTIPISNGRLATGTWQGIWYLEFRASKHSRKVVATIQGEKN
ncbi:uncharacterized protein K452DRAFT_273913 [Aplosporella prunicola CBS 121167]|uniref:Secondary thiamine-phosphate synthase enzyme n=1 Tax=Aplosporella prunicola CBS 121167 TaxID=1176127 RepID=A0A6A6BAJ8_9PEZI|nr:uncharacterized protein K452DRAFT_273913 [Aplosporella prunicola CBS 121167]KAF2140274.1 hypothetical protein K452DRAFT_273913 [Aplosporella prunicola CBS 121167]